MTMGVLQRFQGLALTGVEVGGFAFCSKKALFLLLMYAVGSVCMPGNGVDKSGGLRACWQEDHIGLRCFGLPLAAVF